jgi:hypothetical protein
MRRTAIRHEHNNQLLGFIYQASKQQRDVLTAFKLIGVDEEALTGVLRVSRRNR